MTYKEKFGNIQVLKLNTDSFNDLPEKIKKLAFHLTNAGSAGRKIFVDQKSKFNMKILSLFIELEKDVFNKSDRSVELNAFNKKLNDALFVLFANNGIYDSNTGKNIIPTLSLQLEDFKSINNLFPQYYDLFNEIVYNNKNIKEYKTVQKSGVDIVKESGVNFYDNLTTEEVKKYREEKYKNENNKFPHGFNEVLSKDENGKIHSNLIYSDGLYGKEVKEIIYHLNLALPYTENEQQERSILSLIKFYETGRAEDFYNHCVEWVKDVDSIVYFVNGLIECYEDPLGLVCSYESLVAFKDPVQTEKVKRIIDEIQYFENKLPIDEQFKKEKAVGLSASSINVISMAGATSPLLPLGINLPNSSVIRKEFGSRSVTLANVESARGIDDVSINEVLYLEKYQSLQSYANKILGTLHTDLHEIVGHGSGKSLDGVSSEDLAMYYSIIEETRADLVGLFFVADPKMKEIGIFEENVSLKDIQQAKYISYITNGAIGQLRRIDLGIDLTQAHMRNRHLISTYLLTQADPEKLKMINKDGSYYIELNDPDHVRDLIGVLLAEVQRVKSEGDIEGARYLVETYGTKVNYEIHKEIIERFSELDLATKTAFLSPELSIVDDKVVLGYYNAFIGEQIDFFNKY